MKFKGLYTAVSALTLLAAPTLAAAAPITTPLTQPATETVSGDNDFRSRGGGASYVVLFAAVIAIGLGIYIAVDKNDASPNSP